MRDLRALRTTVAGLVVVAAVLTGCSDNEKSGSPKEASPSTSATSPVKVPEGVTLSDPGSTLAVGKPASVVYRAGENRRSVVTINVKKIRKGTMKDFKHFTLDAKTRSSTPFYVDAVIHNKGPGGLSRAAVPLYGLDSSHTYFPPTGLVGEFDKCQGGALPRNFDPGDSVRRCLVFVVPKRVKLTAIQVRTDDLGEPISWRR